jgi:VWFA-related protein
MRPKIRGWSIFGAAVWVVLVAALSAQTPAPQPAASQPTFRVTIDAVTSDVIVKDSRGQFVPDLTKEDFEIYEDGVKQDIVSMTLVHGGRVTNVLQPPPASVPEGVILPPRRVVNDTSGRIFLFFVDDLHLQFHQSGRVRNLFQKIAKQLLHEGDLFGIVSSGPSSIAIDMTYDRKRVEDAVKKIHGDGLKPSDIIQDASGSQGPTELRHRANVAFSTMREALQNLEKVTNRRKALVWVSEGYDFNPFQASRFGLHPPNSPFLQNQANVMQNSLGDDPNSSARDPLMSAQAQAETFSDADLAYDLAEIARAANRANTTIYTIDPRGLVAGGDIDEQVDPREWSEYLRQTQDTMRVLAEETGGIAVVNMNDFDKALKRIDADTSDYYVLGYVSSNPDPLKRRREIDVKVTRPGLDAQFRTEYVLKPLPVSVPAETTR